MRIGVMEYWSWSIGLLVSDLLQHSITPTLQQRSIAQKAAKETPWHTIWN